MPIRKLPTLVVNQIAAGEVIERPASVVKELVENALDAGATRIEVQVEAGGTTLIRVRDDGSGIPPDELLLAIEPHATSKLERADQLDAIDTLGFRGEALASIASVSRLRLSTRTRDAESAYVLDAQGEAVQPPQPASTPGSHGSILEVRDLFFNTPARRKFLRTEPTEFGHINDALQRIALMHPAVGFTLEHNGRSIFDYPAGEDWKQRCVRVLGQELEEALLDFDELPPMPSDGVAPIHCFGLAGLPSLARATTKGQYLCLNGRSVRDRQLTHAVKEAYRGLIPMDKQPVVVVFLEMDPAAVDVNVHPAKSEVRFRHPQRVHAAVLAALRQRLLGADLTPSLRGPGSGERGAWMFSDAMQKDRPGESEPAIASAFVDYFKRMDPTQKGFVFDEVRREMGKAQEPLADLDDAPLAATGPGRGWNPSILQVHNSYVVTEDEDGLVIVDQHALHERYMFEELKRRVLGPPAPEAADVNPPARHLESQRLLMPETLDADADRQALLDTLTPLLQRIGVEAQPIGPDAVAVHAFPSFLFERGVEPGPFLNDLLDAAERGDLAADDPEALEASLHEVLDMMACKAAVKAGDRLSPDELTALLDRRGEIERSGSCPHGRPTTLRLSLKDLAKQFGRT